MRLNKDIIQSRSNLIHHNEYLILGDYINNRTKITIKHLMCGSTFDQRPDNHISGSKCPMCYSNIKNTQKTIQLKSNKIFDNEYLILSEFGLGNKDSIDIQHIKCGDIFKQLTTNHLAGHRGICKCLRQDIKLLDINDFEIINFNYLSNDESTFKHNCGYIFNRKNKNFLRNKSCPKCNNKIKMDLNLLKEKSVKKYNGEYIIVGDYIDYSTPIDIQHVKCGRIYKQKPSYHISGSGCLYCTKRIKIDYDEISKRLFYYDILSVQLQYKHSSIIEVKCKECSFTQFDKVNNLLRNSCKNCNQYKGPKKISNQLKSSGIRFKTEMKFIDCKYKKTLPFDFYLIDYNICIEFNGKQHYEPIKYFGGDKSFEEQRIRDNIKIDYCIRNKIELIIIRYDDDINLKFNKIFQKMTFTI